MQGISLAKLIVSVCEVLMCFSPTSTGSLQARPLHVKLADSGGAAPQLIAAQTAEFTRGPVIITSTVTFHPAIVRDRERSTATHCSMHITHTSMPPQFQHIMQSSATK